MRRRRGASFRGPGHVTTGGGRERPPAEAICCQVPLRGERREPSSHARQEPRPQAAVLPSACSTTASRVVLDLLPQPTPVGMILAYRLIGVMLACRYRLITLIRRMNNINETLINGARMPPRGRPVAPCFRPRRRARFTGVRPRVPRVMIAAVRRYRAPDVGTASGIKSLTSAPRLRLLAYFRPINHGPETALRRDFTPWWEV
ncbi:hypothetical protein SKAU_G00401790 [Synaphobranchus kaupii]|uniref:Uncharacterized protein n=1 Tax=Synaphobranchus kaupii TaxID=118154 RepID=A0A9Q1E963_SYNKA|nr:hypothetical protein SKAU_G00401790 [Synaphobranchus kaupii]